MKTLRLIFLLFFCLIFYTLGLFSQTGPGGVGNQSGTLGQPTNSIWFAADSLSLSDADPLVTWGDLSGNSNDATQTVASQRPEYRTGQINGKPAIVFDPTGGSGNEDYLPFNGNTVVNSDYTVLFVGQRRTNSSRKIMYGGSDCSSNRNLHSYWYNSSNFRAHHYGNDLSTTMLNNSLSYSGGTDANEYGIFTTLLASSESSNQRRNYQNNYHLGSRSNSTQLISYNNAALARYECGGDFEDIDVAEFIIYSNSLNDAQLQIVQQYLNVKYNINIYNDLYNPSSPYIHNVIGVGSSDGAKKHSQTSGTGGGLLLAERNNSFDESNEYVFASHNNATASEVATDLPSLGSGSLTGRSNRIWYLDRPASTTTDISIGFDFSETGLGAGVENQIFYLLHRTGTSGTFSTVSGAQAILSNGEVWFSVDNANLVDGYYTIARSDQTGRTWYSYNTGDWDNWLTWTLEQGGAGQVNPDNLTPTTSPTAAVDKVVILQPYIVTVSSNNKENALLEVRDGELNLQSTTGHNFDNISGQGKIKLTADNFPSGNSTEFNSAGGGTVEYNGTGPDLTTERSFNNLIVNLSTSTDVITLLADYTLEGDLTVTNGVFRINDNSATDILNFDVADDIIVEANGKITVGEGITIGSYSIPGSMPALGEYHSIYHQVRIGGGMEIDGTVSFTNLSAPDYSQFANNGVTVTFYGASSDTANLNNNVDFYNLIIDKGSDKNYMLTINSANDAYFNLYGPNNVGRRTGGIYTDENPEIRKALWLKNGTLKLDGFISIPSLSEGNQVSGNGDYAIPANARLWIAGSAVNNVRVFSTARTGSAELLPGTVGVNDGSGHQAMSVYGEFKMSNGYFNTRNSAGFIFWSDASAVVDISGGLSDVAQFRSAHGGAGGKTSFVMTGGELMVRGNEQFTYNLDAGAGFSINPDGGGEITGSYPAFGIIDADGAFQMDGGKIYIADESGDNSYNSNALCINAELVNHSVTGGRIYLLLENNEDYDLVSNGALYHLEIAKISGTSNADVHMGGDLSLKGSLTIGDYTSLISRREHSGYYGETYNLEVARGFTVQSNGDYRAYDNTTTLLVTNTSSLTMRNTNQEFFNLIIKNNPDVASTLREFNGNNNTVTVHNDFTIETDAVFNFTNGNKDILVKGNIYNDGTITTDDAADVGAVVLTDRGIVSAINVTSGGTYWGVPTITISAPSSGTQATAIPIFDGEPSAFNWLPLVGIAITNSGDGYTSAPTVTISNNGVGAAATATINQQHKIDGGGNGVFANLEINEPHPSEASGEVDVTYLAANQAVSNVLTLTDGILDLETYNLHLQGDLSTDGSANHETLYSETKLIRMSGNHGDGGLTRYVDANGEYFYPIGTYNTTYNSNRYGWAKPTISSFADAGNVQINAVPRKLATLSDDGSAAAQRYLEYYWRVRYDDFSTVPNVHNQFIGYVNDFTWSGVHTNHIIGKIVNLVRYNQDDHGLGILELAVSDKRILNYSTVTVLEEGEFTAGFKPVFNGSIEVFYSKQPGPFNWYNWQWNDGTHWSFAPHGEASRPNAGDYPKTGDVAVIGYGDYDPTGQHSIIINGYNVSCGEVRFASYNGGSSSRLVVYEGSGLDAGMITGNGTFMIRPNLLGFPTIAGDFSDFVNNTVSVFNYFLDQNGHYNIPTGITTIYPNLRIEGAANRSATIQEDFTVLSNFTIDGNTEYITNSGADGDFVVDGELRIGGYLGGNLSFNTSGSDRNIEVGNVILRDNYPTENHTISVLNTTPSGLEHEFVINGSITQLPTNGSIDLFSNNSGGNNVILVVEGETNDSLYVAAGSVPELYRLELNKGANSDYLFDIQSDISLNGETNGTTKSLELKYGHLKLNHADIDIELSSGGADFYIPSTTAMTITQGTARVTSVGSNGILLDGYLEIGAYGANQGSLILDGGAGSDNYIEYSSSGNAQIMVREGNLLVGSQIRSSTLNNLGVLDYRQRGNPDASLSSQVVVGTRTAPENSRGIFEVMNAGSRFRLTNGSLTIARTFDVPGAATRAALYLDPENTNVNNSGRIQIGLTGTTPLGSVISINSTETLGRIIVDGSSTAKLEINSLVLEGDLEINSGSTFNGNNLNLTLEADITNSGTDDLNVGTLYFEGDAQEIDGDLVVNNMQVKSITSLTLLGATNSVTVNGDLSLSSGQLVDGGNLVSVAGNITNSASHASSGTGRIELNGSVLQTISGTGEFGNLELDNNAGARLLNSVSVNNDFYLTNGILDIQDFNLILSESSDIVGSGFGLAKMITTDGSFADLGITKNIPSGASSFTFPIGVGSGIGAKYTPVEFDITSSTQGSIRLHPVNQAHMTTIGPNVLQYFWNIASSGLSGFHANMKMHYDNADVVGTEADYISAWLYGDSWSKFPTSTVDETNDTILFSFPGVNDISGDYTAGIDSDIPNDIPVYESTGTGDWSDIATWNRLDGEPVPAGGPNGHIVRVLDGHTVSFDRYQILSYRTEINGRLEVGTEVGHNIGYVSGAGTLALVTQKLPVADLTDFLAAGSGSTVEWGGGAYSIPDLTNYGNSYNNLVIAGSGIKQMPHKAIYIRNNLDIQGTATYKATNRTYLYGNLSLAAGAGFVNSYWLHVYGSTNQEFTGDFTGGNAFFYIYINNPNGVTFHGDSYIKNQIYLRNGIVSIDNTKSMHLNGTIYTTSFLDQSWVEGQFVRNLTNGSTASVGTETNLFPVGKNGKPRFVRLYNVVCNPAMPEAWTVDYFDSDPSFAGMDTNARDSLHATKPVHKVSGGEFWMVDGPTPGSASVSIEWGSESGVGETVEDLDGTILVEWDGSKWISRVGTANLVAEGEGYINAADASSFSTKYFSIGADSKSNPLPVELLSFNARAVNDFVEVEWQTATELNNDYFVVERTIDGINFEEIALVEGAGNSNRLLTYRTTDRDPYKGVSYYRLKQVDFDGAFSYSYLVEVILEESYADGKGFDFIMYPNPVTANKVSIVLQNSEKLDIRAIRIIDMRGKTFYYNNNINENRIGDMLNVQFSNIQPGIYNVIIVAGDSIKSKKLMVK